MKYTVYEQKFIGDNLKMYVRVYAKTNDAKNDFKDCEDYVAVAEARTVKEAKQIIEDLGGNFERIA